MIANLPDDVQRVIDTAIYVGLFGFAPDTANVYLSLPQTASEDERRDEMGSVALEALATIEGKLETMLAVLPRPLVLRDFAEQAYHTALEVSHDYRNRGLTNWGLLTANDATGKGA